MVHPFFQKIRDTVRPNLEEQFKTRFAVILDGNENVDTWLDAIADQFLDSMADGVETLHRLVDTGFSEKEKDFLLKNGMTQEDIDNYPGGYHFWVLIRWIHKSLQDRGYDRDDNIFAFMKHQNVDKVRVVLMGQDPLRNSASPGFAFHLEQCPSTWKIISFLKNEINLVSNDESENCHVLQDTCDLGGWIEQNVLLLNSSLTYNSDEKNLENLGWKLITDFFMSYISSKAKLNKNHLVFLLAGNSAQNKWDLIDTHHLKMRLYHPVFYGYPDYLKNFNQDRDWATKLPFMNSNFFLYQINNNNGEENVLIDWVRIKEGSANLSNQRRNAMIRLFEEIVTFAKDQADDVWNDDGKVPWKGFQVRRSKLPNQYFYLERR
ncbi:unnamed protein product [Orchesella dallaii]|uniref:Uracil-DNA glycosylase-like domain-containing protein n=1 Tax=Orchesella dallaii TaxID=48710 RepID=A0ABP1QIQ0_9HEXA